MRGGTEVKIAASEETAGRKHVTGFRVGDGSLPNGSARIITPLGGSFPVNSDAISPATKSHRQQLGGFQHGRIEGAGGLG